MKIHVRLNGALRAEARLDRLTLELPPGATVADVLTELSGRMPPAAPLLARAVAVVAGTHVPGERALAEGDEVALLMPIAGG